jgi:DNA invertase Pin-like site-specific DNA recombinase
VADAEHIATAKRMKADGHTGKDIAKYLGVSRATLYRYLADQAAYATDWSSRHRPRVNANEWLGS